MKIVSIHRKNGFNLGDAVCRPSLYFPELSGETVDIEDEFPEADLYVVGGGGLLHGQWTENLARLPLEKTVFWGVGMNEHDRQARIWPKFLDGAKVIGLRDTGNPWDLVPCPSCIATSFQQFAGLHGKPPHPFVIYEHMDRPLLRDIDAPRMTNRQPAVMLGRIVSFLRSGERVITNTYHGAYWAMLLGIPVIVIDPFASRFWSFEYLPIFAFYDDWQTQLENATAAPPDYLAKCRVLNVKFFEKVKTLL